MIQYETNIAAKFSWGIGFGGFMESCLQRLYLICMELYEGIVQNDME